MKSVRMWHLILLSFFALMVYDSFRGLDSTDNKDTNTRSGLRLYTDYGTGCQYLKASYFAELTKRVDGNGNHVGCR